MWIIVILSLSISCAAPIKAGRMVPYLDGSSFQPASRTVFIAKIKDVPNGDIQKRFLVTGSMLQKALEDSFAKYRILRLVHVNNDAEYELHAEIVSQKIIRGITLNSILFVSYRLVDVDSSEIVWKDNILSQSDRYGGDVAIAVEGTVRDNIAKLLKKLSAIEL
jgi:hypothetical protein